MLNTITAAPTTPLPPWPTGYHFYSPGYSFSYEVIGPCCRLFDREQLPWPCCRIAWRSKEPSWRRIGRRLVVDGATKRHPSYAVYHRETNTVMMITLYWIHLEGRDRQWWYGA
ncbi:hypothetical protein L5470_01435 [Synechococcus sp. PCC 6717]|uniref:Uncharacterized protein n=1 Tax=Parathermosynechococcus lividus PCC 6715 TaxID=1917166 RepID=A0A2D2Q286_PARLV|nr:hypothetical protein [Thermostichus lividus]ATS18608.1 hypothetical protein BRW62_07405 [Thermostichus lividus PCC 6715]MCH9056903.1 hypothetical protein [Synechococcus sp. PCC 6716]MCI3279654.1 hypothetical protein [Synechococcus sp. PCC 6717]